MPRLYVALLAVVTVIGSTVSRPLPTVGSITPAAPMLEPRSGHSAVLLTSGKVLIAGGMRRNQGFYRSAELYDPSTGKFQPTGQMQIARVGPSAVLLNSGKVLLVGGWIGQGSTDEAELYDPATGKFTALNAKMTVRRGRPTATVLSDGDVLITGGSNDDSPGGVASAELFHPATQTFQALSPMHFARISHTATLLKSGQVLIVGGRGESVTATTELYDPQRKAFTLTGSMQTARYKHTAGLLPDGRVLIAGGSDERDWSANLSSAEIYDPATGKFASALPLNDPRFKLPEEAVALGSGDLLVAGGSKQAEIYEPESGKFLRVPGDMADGWHFMTETRLQDGSVLLAGGYANSDRATERTWLYRP